MVKADDLVKSMTPEALDKARDEIHGKVRSAREETENEDQKPADKDKNNDRIDKLDLISDVQLIVVGKFQSIVRLMWVAIIIVLFVLAAQVLQFFRQLDLQGKIIVISESQHKMLEEQRKIVETAKENTQKVAEVKKEVSETKEQVKEAVEASPKIEIDPASGKAKVVVPVKKSKPKDDDKKGADTKKGADKSDTPQAPPAPPVPAPTQVELRNEF